MIELENDTTFQDAINRLQDAEASEPQIPKEHFVQADEPPQQPEATQGQDGKTSEIPEKSGTPATSEAKSVEKKADTKQKTETKPQEDKAKSKFAANNERLEKTWKSVNERKTQLDNREQQIAQKEQMLSQREQRMEAQRLKSSQKFTPEQYEQAAQNKWAESQRLSLQADGLERQAEKLDESGQAGKAELARQQAQDLREQAAGEKYAAKQLKLMGQQVKSQPLDKSLQEISAKSQLQMREYTIKAAQEWPELAKQGSEFQKKMAGHLKALADQGLTAEEFPVLMYQAARFTHLESEAARVPELTKELDALRAKVKEYEALTQVGGGQGSVQRQSNVKSFDEMNDAEQESTLRAMALQM